MNARPIHWLDRAYAKAARGPLFFEDGWGPEDILPLLEARAEAFTVPAAADVRWDGPARAHPWLRGPDRARVRIRRGSFRTPFPSELLPEESHRVPLLLVTPDAPARPPMVVHLAGAGDEGFVLRSYLAAPLAARGIGAVIFENPFYGQRRPAGQRGVGLRRATDQFVMNMATVEESAAVLQWLLEAEHPAVGITGYSMGGYVAAMVGAMFPAPLAVIPCAAGISPVPVFTEGLLSRLIAWERLAEPGRERLAFWLDRAALHRLPLPRRPEASVLLGAERDGYVHPDTVHALHRHWRGSSLHWVDGGHVSSVLMRRDAISAAVQLALRHVVAPTTMAAAP